MKTKLAKERARPRALMQQPALALLGGGAQSIPIRVIDISSSGLQIWARDIVEKKFIIRWSPLAGLENIEFSVEVVWKRKDRLGLVLKGLKKNERHMIKSLIKYHR